jgi:hypothetical protein
MTLHDDLPDRTIERRLRARAPVAPSPGHRSRVLAAVRGTIEARPVATVARGHGLGGGGVFALTGMAVAAAPLVIGPWCLGLAAAATGAAPAGPARPTLVAQARLVGVELSPDALAAVGPVAGYGARRPGANPTTVDGPSASPGRAAGQWLRMRHTLVREL